MNIIHGTWIPENKETFFQKGGFYLWVEKTAIKKQNDFHLQHLEKDELKTFLGTELKSIDLVFEDYDDIDDYIVVKYFLLPGANTNALASYDMMRYSGLEIPEEMNLQYWEITCFKVNNVIKFLNDIHFISLHNSDIQLGTDISFWYYYGRSFKEIIRQEQYIPALTYHEPANTETNTKKKGKKSKAATSYQIYPGWEIISEKYNSEMDKFIAFMPPICVAGFETITKQAGQPELYQKESILRHFSESHLHELIENTKYTAKFDKLIEDSFIYHCVHPDESESKITLEEYKQWYLWRQNLVSSHSDTGFHLCFRLVEPSEDNYDNWQIDFMASSKKDPSLRLELEDYWHLKPKKRQETQKHFGSDFERTLLLNMGYAAKMYNKIWTGLESATPTRIMLSTEEAFDFLKQSSWVLEEAGYKVIIPSWWTPEGRKRAKIRLKTSSKSSSSKSVGKGYFSLDSIIHYQYQLSIGDQVVSQKEWQELVNAKSSLVYFRGQWMELDKDNMAKMLEFWQKHSEEKNEMTLLEVMKMSSEQENELDFDHDETLAAMMAKLKDKNRFEAIEPSNNFNGILREYQKRGLSWLYYLENIGLNPCLADDMGLGKTIQVIALLIHEKDAFSNNQDQLLPTLLIAPTSVLGNWQKEVKRFAPQLSTMIHHGSARLTAADFKKERSKHDMVITSFSLARKDEKLLTGMQWQRIILDEAQNIKNPKAAQTKAILKLKAKHKMALTGTPVENRLLDLWSIFNFLNTGYLGKEAQFRKNFELAIQKNNDYIKSAILKKLVEPFILRRVKTDKDIIKDLPDKIEQKLYCHLTKEQASLYQAVVKEVTDEIEDSEGIQRKGLILSSLIKLKQICNHPRQFLQDGSEFTLQRSHKLSRLSEMIEEVIDNNESLLIFSQFKEIGDALQDYIRKTLHYNCYYIHGGVTRAKREKMIAEYQDPETEASVFILSLKAGGVGITLTKANHVFHFDRWWNPAVEDQATDRAFRIGQKKNVFVHKFVTIGTLEERIDLMIEDKKKLASLIVESDESWLTELDNDAFKQLIELNKEAILED